MDPPDSCDTSTDAWGSNVSIASLEGRSIPSLQPESEPWMGADEEGPATTTVTAAPDLASLVAADLVGERGRSSSGTGAWLPSCSRRWPARDLHQADPSAEQATACGSISGDSVVR